MSHARHCSSRELQNFEGKDTVVGLTKWSGVGVSIVSYGLVVSGVVAGVETGVRQRRPKGVDGWMPVAVAVVTMVGKDPVETTGPPRGTATRSRTGGAVALRRLEKDAKQAYTKRKMTGTAIHRPMVMAVGAERDSAVGSAPRIDRRTEACVVIFCRTGAGVGGEAGAVSGAPRIDRRTDVLVVIVCRKGAGTGVEAGAGARSGAVPRIDRRTVVLFEAVTGAGTGGGE